MPLRWPVALQEAFLVERKAHCSINHLIFCHLNEGASQSSIWTRGEWINLKNLFSMTYDTHINACTVYIMICLSDILGRNLKRFFFLSHLNVICLFYASFSGQTTWVWLPKSICTLCLSLLCGWFNFQFRLFFFFVGAVFDKNHGWSAAYGFNSEKLEEKMRTTEPKSGERKCSSKQTIRKSNSEMAFDMALLHSLNEAGEIACYEKCPIFASHTQNMVVTRRYAHASITLSPSSESSITSNSKKFPNRTTPNIHKVIEQANKK